MLVVSAITLISGWINSATSWLYAQSSYLEQKAAAYDLVHIIQRNATFISCISQPICLSNAEKNLDLLFEVNGISITTVPQNTSCATALGGNQTFYVCVSG